MNDTPWVIWSKDHHAWWGPSRAGYSRDLLFAGLYSEEEAKRISARSKPRAGSRLPPGAVSDEAQPLAAAIAADAKPGNVAAYLAVRSEPRSTPTPNSVATSTTLGVAEPQSAAPTPEAKLLTEICELFFDWISNNPAEAPEPDEQSDAFQRLYDAIQDVTGGFPRCLKCSAPMDAGEAKTFSLCPPCWNIQHPKPEPVNQ